MGLKAYKNLLAMSPMTRHWSAAHTPSNVVRDNWTKDEIVLEVQNAQEDGEDVKRTLAV